MAMRFLAALLAVRGLRGAFGGGISAAAAARASSPAPGRLPSSVRPRRFEPEMGGTGEVRGEGRLYGRRSSARSGCVSSSSRLCLLALRRRLRSSAHGAMYSTPTSASRRFSTTYSTLTRSPEADTEVTLATPPGRFMPGQHRRPTSTRSPTRYEASGSAGPGLPRTRGPGPGAGRPTLSRRFALRRSSRRRRSACTLARSSGKAGASAGEQLPAGDAREGAEAGDGAGEARQGAHTCFSRRPMRSITAVSSCASRSCRAVHGCLQTGQRFA